MNEIDEEREEAIKITLDTLEEWGAESRFIWFRELHRITDIDKGLLRNILNELKKSKEVKEMHGTNNRIFFCLKKYYIKCRDIEFRFKGKEIMLRDGSKAKIIQGETNATARTRKRLEKQTQSKIKYKNKNKNKQTLNQRESSAWRLARFDSARFSFADSATSSVISYRLCNSISGVSSSSFSSSKSYSRLAKISTFSSKISRHFFTDSGRSSSIIITRTG